MNAERNNLSDEDFCEMLMGRTPARNGATRDAVSNGTPVTGEVEAMSQALSSYRTESLQWAERRSATQPSLAGTARRNARWFAAPQWALAAVAVVTVAAGLVHFSGNSQADAGSEIAVAVVPAPQATGGTLKADNALLASIDQVLNDGGASSMMNELQLKPSHESVRRNGSTE